MFDFQQVHFHVLTILGLLVRVQHVRHFQLVAIFIHYVMLLIKRVKLIINKPKVKIFRIISTKDLDHIDIRVNTLDKASNFVNKVTDNSCIATIDKVMANELII